MSAFKATKKPVTIEAIELKKSNVRDVLLFIGQDVNLESEHAAGMFEGYVRIVCDQGMRLKTLESDGQTQVADIGDYIIKGVQGEFYPCKPDIFKATYNYRCKCGEDISFESVGCIYCKN